MRWPWTRQLRVGDRVRVSGSYDHHDTWIDDAPDGYTGTVRAFIPAEGDGLSAVVRLDELIIVDVPRNEGRLRAQGQYLVLSLAHEGADWTRRSERIHVELCDFEPEPRPWSGRRQGAWVESHAHHEILQG